MKKIFSTIALAALMLTAVTSCNNQPKKNDTPQEPKGSVSAQASNGQLKLAYVEFDSIATQYNFAKDADKILKAKGTNLQKTITQKQQAVQQAAANFQQNLRANKYTQQQAEQIQAGIQKQAQDGEALSQRLQGEYAQEQAKYQKAIVDSVQNYLKVYNKDKKFDFIFTRSGILYAKDAYNITDEVVKGLNKAYKKK